MIVQGQGKQNHFVDQGLVGDAIVLWLKITSHYSNLITLFSPR